MSGLDASLDIAEDYLGNLFVCEEYIEKSWTFGGLTQPLLCSNMSSTDHDLTGQIVWPACVLLSWFIYGNRTLFKGVNVIELGAGCGLAGFVAANYCRSCCITDGNDIVMKLLKQNAEFLKTENVSVQKLLWGVKSEVEGFELVPGSTIDGKTGGIDIVIGADVILWPNQVMSLLYTVRWLLSPKQSTAACYISYIVRANSTTDLLFKTASSLGLIVDTIPISSFVPSDCTAFDSMEKMLLKIMINESVSDEALKGKEITDIEQYGQSMLVSNMPC